MTLNSANYDKITLKAETYVDTPIPWSFFNI